MLTQDRDEELVLFLEMRHREKDHLILGSNTMPSQKLPRWRTAADNFLYSENEKSDYDWLVTPPGSPTKSLTNDLDAPDVNPMALQSRLRNYFEEGSNNISSKKQMIGLKRPSSSNSSRSMSRPSTPTKRSTTPTSRITSTASRAASRSMSRPSTPTKTLCSSKTSVASRATLTSHSTSTSRSTSRASTPTKRPSSSGTSRATSSTTSTRLTSRPSTPTNRPPSSGTSRANLTAARAPTGSASSTRSNSRPMTAPGSRSSTPTRRPATPTSSSSVLKTKPAHSPILRSRPWEPYEMPGFSQDAPSNLRTTLPERPQNASSRGTRASSASSSRSSSIEPVVGRKQSCSPSRNRAPNGKTNGNGPMLRGQRGKTSNEDKGLSSGAKGNQRVERVVNTRKLAPPRVTEIRGGGSGSDGFGVGRNLSQSSIDMALRHLGVKRGSMTGNFNKVPAASVYSVGSSRACSKRPVSSSGSSESSVNILCLDGSEDNLSDISYS